MFHKAAKLEFMEGTRLEVSFQDGAVKSYDVAALFEKHPGMKALGDRELFRSGRLMGAYGIVWNDELDLEVETVYEEGETVRAAPPAPCAAAGEAVLEARARAGWSQMQLSRASGIDQSDISKIERGIANPSIATLGRLAGALGSKLVIAFEEDPVLPG